MNTKRLIELREQKGLTREEFAEKLGVSKFTYRSYEQGVKMASLTVLKLMAVILHCKVDDLI